MKINITSIGKKLFVPGTNCTGADDITKLTQKYSRLIKQRAPPCMHFPISFFLANAYIKSHQRPLTTSTSLYGKAAASQITRTNQKTLRIEIGSKPILGASQVQRTLVCYDDIERIETVFKQVHKNQSNLY